MHTTAGRKEHQHASHEPRPKSPTPPFPLPTKWFTPAHQRAQPYAPRHGPRPSRLSSDTRPPQTPLPCEPRHPLRPAIHPTCHKEPDALRHTHPI